MRALNIGVIAPASQFSDERLEESIHEVRSWGHRLLRAPQLMAQQLSFAGSREDRFQDLEWALDHREVDLIWCARGGYGCAELLPLLASKQRAIDKPLLGFSDITALGVYSAYRPGAPVYHAPVLHSLIHGSDDRSRKHLRRFLAEEKLPTLNVTPWRAPPHPPIHAPLAGGNLCVLTTLMGTPHQPRFAGKILMLEDIAEPAYKIHRMLTQLLQGGLLEEVHAIILGPFTRCPSPTPHTIDDFILDALSSISCPLYRAPRFGHGLENDIWGIELPYILTESSLAPELPKLST